MCMILASPGYPTNMVNSLRGCLCVEVSMWALLHAKINGVVVSKVGIKQRLQLPADKHVQCSPQILKQSAQMLKQPASVWRVPRVHVPLGGSGGMPLGKFSKNRSPEMQFEAFWVLCGRKKCVIFLSVFVYIWSLY